MNRKVVFHSKIEWLNVLKPNFKLLPLNDRIICSMGAFIGLLISSCISWWVLGEINPWYIAPMGASAILLFAVPASPLSQPWNIVVGNSIAALVGVLCYHLIPNLSLAFSTAVAISIVIMMSTDSLHPPSGAVAITAVLGGSAVHDLGYYFLFYPVLLNSILLLVVAIVFNRLCGRQYPYVAQINQRTTDPTPTQKVSIQPKDIQEVLDQQTELLDISEYDLQKIILEAQAKANLRQNSVYTCRDIMSSHVVSLNQEDDIQLALNKFKDMNLMSLPVINDENQLVGTLALYEVVEWFKQSADLRSTWKYKVEHIMVRQVVTVKSEQRIEDLIPYFVERSFNYIPVVDHQKMVGIISRADMIAALNQQLIQQVKDE